MLVAGTGCDCDHSLVPLSADKQLYQLTPPPPTPVGLIYYYIQLLRNTDSEVLGIALV